MIGIASDHAGFHLKEHLISHLKSDGKEVLDYGPTSSERTDYPLFAQTLAKGILNNDISQGILICGSGIGMSIAANRFKGIRAALCLTPEMASLSRAHNDANVLVLGARLISEPQAAAICDAFLAGSFEGDRHTKRLQLIEEL